MTIKLTDAAKYYKELPHQREAWEWLQTKLSQADLDEFTKRYREEPNSTSTTDGDGGSTAAQ